MDELDEIRKRKMEELEKRFSRNREEMAIDAPVQVTATTFDRFIKEHRVAVIDFWNEWCAPCFMIAPIIEELAKDYAGKVVFGKLNTDESPAIAVKYNVMAIPTLLFFKNEKPVDRIIGAVPKDHIEWKLKKIIG